MVEQSVQAPAVLLNPDGTIREFVDHNGRSVYQGGKGGSDEFPAGMIISMATFVYLNVSEPGNDSPSCYILHNGKLYKLC